MVVQPFKGFTFGQRHLAVLNAQLANAQLFYSGLLLRGVTQQAVKNVALGRFFEMYAHGLVRAQRHEVWAVAEAELEVNLLGFGPREQGRDWFGLRNTAPARRPGRAHRGFERRRGWHSVGVGEERPGHKPLRANIKAPGMHLKRLHERGHKLLEIAFLDLSGHHDKLLLKKRQQLAAIYLGTEGVEQIAQQQPGRLQTYQHRILVLEVEPLALVLDGGEVVRAFLVASEMEQDGRLGRSHSDFLPGGLPIAAHNKHVLAGQAGQHGPNACLHLPGNGLLQRLVAFFGVVDFEKKLGRGNFAGPEFLHNGFLLKLVAESDELEIGGIKAGGKFVHVLARYRLMLERELAARAQLHHVGREQVSQVLVLEEGVNDLKRFCSRYFHGRARSPNAQDRAENRNIRR